MYTRSVRSLAFVGLVLASGAGCALEDPSSSEEELAQASTPTWTWGFAKVDPGVSLSPLESYNSSGGANSYGGSAGSYWVFMPGLDQSGGNVQVVAFGAGAVRCKVSSWGTSGSGTLVNVRCHDPAGALAASPFIAYYDKGGTAVGSSYLWYDGSGVPATYSYNDAGSTNAVTRLGVGRYRAFLNGLSSGNASVHVTAYGTGPEHCAIESYWSGATVYVRCFDAAGALVDSRFSLHFTNSAPRAGMVGGHAYINGATSAPSSLQTNERWLACGSAPVTVAGYQTVTYPDTYPQASFPITSLTTAYGTSGAYCKIAQWAQSGTGYWVRTQCYSPAGAPVTGPFVSSFMVAVAPGPC